MHLGDRADRNRIRRLETAGEQPQLVLDGEHRFPACLDSDARPGRLLRPAHDHAELAGELSYDRGPAERLRAQLERGAGVPRGAVSQGAIERRRQYASPESVPNAVTAPRAAANPADDCWSSAACITTKVFSRLGMTCQRILVVMDR